MIKKILTTLSFFMIIFASNLEAHNLQESIKIGENNGLAIINVSRGILTYGKGDINDIRKATEMYTNEIRSVL